MFDRWFTGKKLIEAQTEAKAKEAALKSVGTARSVEVATRRAADYHSPPIDPYEGQTWVAPDGLVKVWNGKEFVDAEDYSTEPSDVFNDGTFSRD